MNSGNKEKYKTNMRGQQTKIHYFAISKHAPSSRAITGMSIVIFVRVLDNSSQRAYFRSCDGNTATPLADKRGIGRFMGFPVLC